MTERTDRDPRIAAAELMTAGLEASLSSLPRPAARETSNLARGLRSSAAALRYSFLSSREADDQGLLDPLVAGGRRLLEVWRGLAGRGPSPSVPAAWLRAAGLTLSTLRRRMLEGEPTFAWAVPSMRAAVKAAIPSGGLTALDLDVRGERFSVVTSLPGVGRGDVVAFAILPPRKFGSVVSEGMLVEARPAGGGEGGEAEGEGEPGEPALPVGRSVGEVEAALRAEAARLGVRI